MSALSMLRKTLLLTGWVVKQDAYIENIKNRADRFIIYNLAHEEASGFSDNHPRRETSYWQVHIYLPETQNPSAIKKQVKSLLSDAGFSYPEVVLDVLEQDVTSNTGEEGMETSGRKRHICLETNITLEMED